MIDAVDALEPGDDGEAAMLALSLIVGFAIVRIQTGGTAFDVLVWASGVSAALGCYYTLLIALDAWRGDRA